MADSKIAIRENRRKKCSRCGGTFDEEAFFRLNPDQRLRASIPARRSVCIGCEITDRNEPTPEQRARRKADNTRQHHAQKYGLLPREFGGKYGWDIERMAHDLIHAHENTCGYCWVPYETMGHGLDDVTLDILDTKREPYYHTDVQWCCRTCNSEKATLAPEIWARRLIAWKEYALWKARVEKQPTFGLPLFD